MTSILKNIILGIPWRKWPRTWMPTFTYPPLAIECLNCLINLGVFVIIDIQGWVSCHFDDFINIERCYNLRSENKPLSIAESPDFDSTFVDSIVSPPVFMGLRLKVKLRTSKDLTGLYFVNHGLVKILTAIFKWVLFQLFLKSSVLFFLLSTERHFQSNFLKFWKK